MHRTRRLVPQPYQVLWANGIGFFWNAYMSAQCFKATDEDLAADAAIESASSSSSGSSGDGSKVSSAKQFGVKEHPTALTPLREEIKLQVRPSAVANEQYVLHVRRRGA